MRTINDKFMYDLKQGKLADILKTVKADDTLCLEIRENFINIYYRGGSILKITEKGENYIFEFDSNYCVDNGGIFETFDVRKLSTVDDYIKYFPQLKREMDNWFSQHPNWSVNSSSLFCVKIILLLLQMIPIIIYPILNMQIRKMAADSI